MEKPSRSSQRGVTLIELIIVVAILGVIMMAFTSMMANQLKATQAIGEKLAAQDTSRSIIAALANSTTCSQLVKPSNLVNPGSIPFSSAGLGPASPRQIPLKQIPLSPDGALVLQAGTAPSPNSRLTLNAENDPVPGIVLSVSSPTAATLFVNFNKDKQAMQLHDLSFPVQIQTTGSGMLTIVGCAGAVGNRTVGRMFYGTPGTYSFTVPPGVSSVRVSVVGGGGGGQPSSMTIAPRPGVPFGTGSIGLGGTGGASVIAVMALAEGVTIPVVVGAGGAGGTPGNRPTPGSASQFGTMITAPGGASGGPSAAIPPTAPLPFVLGPFAPSVSPTVDSSVQVLIANPDTQGTAAMAASCGNVLGGAGGPGLWGGGGASTAAESDGSDALGYGGGGSGAASSCGNPAKAGGSGHGGAVLIEW